MKKSIIFASLALLCFFTSCNNGKYLATNYTFINLEVGDSVLLETYNVKYIDGIEGIHYYVEETDDRSLWWKEYSRDTICTISNPIGKNTMVYGLKVGEAYINISYQLTQSIFVYRERLVIPVHVSEKTVKE